MHLPRSPLFRRLLHPLLRRGHEAGHDVRAMLEGLVAQGCVPLRHHRALVRHEPLEGIEAHLAPSHPCAEPKELEVPRLGVRPPPAHADVPSHLLFGHVLGSLSMGLVAIIFSRHGVFPPGENAGSNPAGTAKVYLSNHLSHHTLGDDNFCQPQQKDTTFPENRLFDQRMINKKQMFFRWLQ